MRRRLTSRAIRDLESIETYIHAHNPAAAQRVGDELQNAFRLLEAYPYSGRAISGGRRRLALRRFPYLVLYRVDELAGMVTVLTIRHTSRAPLPGS